MVHDYLLGNRRRRLMAQALTPLVAFRMRQTLCCLASWQSGREARHHVSETSIAIEDVKFRSSPSAPRPRRAVEVSCTRSRCSPIRVTFDADHRRTTPASSRARLASPYRYRHQAGRRALRPDPEHWGETAKARGLVVKPPGSTGSPPAPAKGQRRRPWARARQGQHAPLCDAPGTYVLMP